jgi:hypothetical protein
MKILDIITDEVQEYLFGTTEIAEGITFNEYRLKKRIQYFKNRHYPTGKVDDEGQYELWFDLIHPRVNDEVKNLSFDSKHILIFSRNPIKDFPAVYIANATLADWMEKNGRAEELKESVEDFSADGNILFRKTSNGYEKWDMLNTFMTNPTARTVEDTDIIERFYLSQSELRKKQDIYKNVDEVIRDCGNKFFSKMELGVEEAKSKPMYELYRRTGEMSEKDLFEAQGKEGGDENKYVLARVIVAGLRKGKKNGRYVLFAEELSGTMSDYFKEAHRGPYKGRWFREGLYELLFDQQVRYNDICNQIARGLAWVAKILFRATDAKTLQNVRTALTDGSIINSADIQQIAVRVQGFDQLINDREYILRDADRIANSAEIVQGGDMPSDMPFRLGLLMDVNASKLYSFLRKKFGIAYCACFEEFVLKQHIKELKGEDIIRLSGDPGFIDRFHTLMAESWYYKNLAIIGPHGPEVKAAIIEEKLQEMKRLDPTIKNVREIWDDVLKRLSVTITGENYNTQEIETIANMLQYETDPMRRAYLLDFIYAAKGIPVPPQVQTAVPQNQQQGSQPIQGKKDTGFDVLPEKEEDPAEAAV